MVNLVKQLDFENKSHILYFIEIAKNIGVFGSPRGIYQRRAA